MKHALNPALGALAVAGLISCQAGNEPDSAVFSSAMQTYLAERGQLCLAKSHWPIDVTQHEVDIGARNALQMPVLERLGLVASSPAEVDADADQGTPHRIEVRRYALTDAGRRFYITRASSRKAGAAPQADFCAARLSLDRVVGWDLHKAANGAAARAVVTYTYQVEAAPWTSDAEAQKVFPVVAGVVRGAGKAQLQETFVLTAAGWVAADLEGAVSSAPPPEGAHSRSARPAEGRGVHQ
jgi:hypothetical protein